MNQSDLTGPVRTAVEIAVYLLLVLAIVVYCLRIVAPFIPFLLWGAVIAVAVYTPFLKLRQACGGRNKLAVFMFTLIGLTIIVVPTWLLAGSLIGSAEQLIGGLEAGQLELPGPGDGVKEWPLVGERLYQSWLAASQNLEGWLGLHAEQLKAVAAGVLKQVAEIGLSVVQLIAATLIAAAMLANDETTRAMIRRFARRLVRDRADEFLGLTTTTIRSVAVGVLGVAFIQAVAGGIGMALAGVPGAGLWALFILILAIAQLPPLLVLLPAIIFVFSTGDSTVVAVVFAIWSILVSFSDALLKPLLLGRGVEAPMLVILLGAIGGMLYAGIIGLFLGAVILALGYKLFQAWLQLGAEEQPEQG